MRVEGARGVCRGAAGARGRRRLGAHRAADQHRLGHGVYMLERAQHAREGRLELRGARGAARDAVGRAQREVHEKRTERHRHTDRLLQQVRGGVVQHAGRVGRAQRTARSTRVERAPAGAALCGGRGTHA